MRPLYRTRRRRGAPLGRERASPSRGAWRDPPTPTARSCAARGCCLSRALRTSGPGSGRGAARGEATLRTPAMASTGAAAGFFGITAPSAYAETLADSLGLNKLASNWSAALGTTTAPGSGEAPGKPVGEAGGEGDGAGDAAQTEAQKQLKQLTCVRAARATRRAAARAAPCNRRRAATRWDARGGRAG